MLRQITYHTSVRPYCFRRVGCHYFASGPRLPFVREPLVRSRYSWQRNGQESKPRPVDCADAWACPPHTNKLSSEKYQNAGQQYTVHCNAVKLAIEARFCLRSDSLSRLSSFWATCRAHYILKACIQSSRRQQLAASHCYHCVIAATDRRRYINGDDGPSVRPQSVGHVSPEKTATHQI